MEVREALDVLGLGWNASFEDMRHAYRGLLHAHHPDHDPSPDAAERTSRCVDAFRCLREATGEGTRPLSAPPVPVAANTPLVLHTGPGDIFSRLHDALGTVGQISYADRETALLATVLDGGGSPAELTAEVIVHDGETQIMFTLEPLGPGLAPDIAEVVAGLRPLLGPP